MNKIGGDIISFFDTLNEFKSINIFSIDDIYKYFEMVDYEACEYNFISAYMWQSVYNFHYIENGKFMIIFGEYGEELFSVMPYCREGDFEEAMEVIFSIFRKINKKITFRAITEDVVTKIKDLYPGKFEFSTNRDDSDYVYDADKLRTLAGRSMHSKKNHYNSFVKMYEDRFVYKRLSKKDFDECIRLAEKWAFSRDKDQNLVGENLAIKKVFKNYSKINNLIVGGLYIDNVLEAFTYGDYLNEDTALIHIEKANPDIRGLYTAINKLFLENEFPSVKFVNREDDLGLDGLRQAKLSYKPIKLVDKYSAIEV